MHAIILLKTFQIINDLNTHLNVCVCIYTQNTDNPGFNPTTYFFVDEFV